MTVTLELTRDEAAAVAVALNALINDEVAQRLSMNWCLDARNVFFRLEDARAEADW